jgi:hypothetical protein
MYKNFSSLIYPGLFLALAVSAGIILVLLSVGGLGYAFSHLFSITPFQGIVVSLTIICFSGLTASIFLLAANIKKTADHFSVLQLEDSEEPGGEDYDEYSDDYDSYDNERDLNEFLRKISKSRKSITRNDLCPCGSGLKLKDCCGAV